jgi:hypothetical protein
MIEVRLAVRRSDHFEAECDERGLPVRLRWLPGEPDATATIPPDWPFEETFRIVLGRRTLPWVPA